MLFILLILLVASIFISSLPEYKSVEYTIHTEIEEINIDEELIIKNKTHIDNTNHDVYYGDDITILILNYKKNYGLVGGRIHNVYLKNNILHVKITKPSNKKTSSQIAPIIIHIDSKTTDVSIDEI